MSQRPREAAGAQLVELLVGDLVEPGDLAAVVARQLREPDVGGLGHQHQLGHPVAILAEGLRFLVEAAEARRARRRRHARRCRRHPARASQATRSISSSTPSWRSMMQQVGIVEPAGPVDADPAQLCTQRLRRCLDGLEQPLPQRASRGLAVEVGIVGVRGRRRPGHRAAVAGPASESDGSEVSSR